MAKILIVEDELPISNLIDMNLTQAGYECECVYDGNSAADKVENGHFDLILLDIMLPYANGYELLEYIKPYDIPVIFITAKGTVEDRIKGLKLGADDYLAKPFEIMELLARVEAVLRRYNKADKVLTIGDVEVNTMSRRVTKTGKDVNLTMKEYELLLLFLNNRNIALFRDVIFERVWETEFMGDTRTVDLHVQRLRKKLGWEERIQSVYKVGYRLVD